MTSKKRYLKLTLFFCAVLFLSSCALIPDLKFWLTKINITSDVGINNKCVIVCDVVACYNDSIAAELREMSSKQYFVSKATLLKKNGEDMQVVAHICITPGQRKENIKVKLNSYSKAKGLFFYAKYKTDGEFALSLGKEPVITVHLKESEVTQYPGPIRTNTAQTSMSGGNSFLQAASQEV